MTAQAADILWLDGRQLRLLSNPLESQWSKAHPRPKFVAPMTCLYRGYIATWLIEDGRLYLTAIEGMIATDAEGRIASGRSDFMQETILEGLRAAASKPIPATLALLFPGAGDRVLADWFTGVLRVAIGERVQQTHQGYGAVYERELSITIKRGEVTRTEVLAPEEVVRRRDERFKQLLDRPLPARPNDRGWITCPHCYRIFRVGEQECWDGERHACGGRVSLGEADAD